MDLAYRVLWFFCSEAAALCCLLEQGRGAVMGGYLDEVGGVGAARDDWALSGLHGDDLHSSHVMRQHEPRQSHVLPCRGTD